MAKRSRPALTACVSLLLSLLSVSSRAHAQASACAVDTIPRAELADVMRTAALSHGEYDLLATPNWPRFQSALYLGLVRRAMEREPLGGVLFITPEYLFSSSFIWPGCRSDQGPRPSVVGAPPGSRHAARVSTGWHRRIGKGGTHPTLAINIRTAWPRPARRTDKFSVLDTLSVPKLSVTNRQEITYRMLVFGDMVMYDEIRGTSGRPLSGVLGALFSLIGEGSLVYYRSILADDGLQVVRVKAKKMIFSKTTTITVYPDGRAENGVPPDRPALAATEELLKQDREIEYYRSGAGEDLASPVATEWGQCLRLAVAPFGRISPQPSSIFTSSQIWSRTSSVASGIEMSSSAAIASRRSNRRVNLRLACPSAVEEWLPASRTRFTTAKRRSPSSSSRCGASSRVRASRTLRLPSLTFSSAPVASSQSNPTPLTRSCIRWALCRGSRPVGMPVRTEEPPLSKLFLPFSRL